MPVLIDEDLVLEENGRTRPATVANQWLRELPVSGAPAPRTWRVYADAVRQWLEFLAARVVDPFGERVELRGALSSYAGHRLAGPLEERLAPSTWNLHMKALSSFYRWLVEEGHAAAVPFTYKHGLRLLDGVPREYEYNMAKVRQPKPHTTIKYLEPDFTEMFVKALAGLRPDGTPDDGYRGRELGRNAAMAKLVLASGLRRQEFTHLLVYEVPPLPRERTVVPIPFATGHGVTKGSKQRMTWISYDALAKVHEHMELERALAAEGSLWRPSGEPLHVTSPDWEGGTINGTRLPWRSLKPAERLRLVAPDGGSCLLALQSSGAPFVDWDTVFRRTSRRIRARFEPRFPIVASHRLRHTMAMRTLELLTRGYYQRAAALVADTDTNAGLALYLTKHDPWQILRDLLGHSSVTTTQVYIRRLDTTRIFREAYEQAGLAAGLIPSESDPTVMDEMAAEFEEDEGWCRQL
ncbi:tyrosine-type recombinase/integrase [Nonomuraea wenchangensis]